MKHDPYVIGVDFGTDSVRSLLVSADDGDEVASSVEDYPRWSQELYCDPAGQRYRQHPLDYVETLESTVRGVLEAAVHVTPEQIVGIGIDTTGSTPVAVDREGTPLALTPGFEENPNAMFVLWKDHTAVQEAADINETARSWGGEDFTRFSGGAYSSEWFWAKMLHVVREDEGVGQAAFSWVEHCDWMPALLTGTTDPLTMKRSRCAAGHKAMWHESWGGLPSEDFFAAVDPILSGVTARLYRNTETSDMPAGTLSPEWAGRLGLPVSVVVPVGAIDAHLGAVGGGISPYVLSKVIGTSTCDMLVAPLGEMDGKLVNGICGQVDGSIIPGMLGMEAGQSAFGDVYAWFKRLLLWPVESVLPSVGVLDDATLGRLISALDETVIPELSKRAEHIAPEESGIVALDWLNGRRTPDANQALVGALMGLDLGTDAPRLFRALVEATAFGSKKIMDRFLEEGVPIEGVNALGGIAKRSPFVMQVLADVLGVPIQVVRSEQTVAIGSAMAAATAAGVHPDIETAQRKMGSGFETTYEPDSTRVEQYRGLYDRYSSLGDFVEDQHG
jgi:L-ribulokinase